MPSAGRDRDPRQSPEREGQRRTLLTFRYHAHNHLHATEKPRVTCGRLDALDGRIKFVDQICHQSGGDQVERAKALQVVHDLAVLVIKVNGLNVGADKWFQISTVRLVVRPQAERA